MIGTVKLPTSDVTGKSQLSNVRTQKLSLFGEEGFRMCTQLLWSHLDPNTMVGHETDLTMGPTVETHPSF